MGPRASCGAPTIPHRDGVFPDSRKVITEGMGHLDDAVTQQIVCGNAARLYNFN